MTYTKRQFKNWGTIGGLISKRHCDGCTHLTGTTCNLSKRPVKEERKQGGCGPERIHFEGKKTI